MAALVSYDMAVRHLKQEGVLDGSPSDTDVEAKIVQASAFVINHLKRPAEWDINSDAVNEQEFAIVQAAVLRVLGNLYRFRGDDAVSPEPISKDVERMLSMLRDDAFA